MMTSLLLVAILGLQTEAPPRAPTTPQTKQSTTSFQDLLTANEELRTHHRGYRQYLLANPKLAAAELAWLDVTQVSSIRTVEMTFDEALNDDPRHNASPINFTINWHAISRCAMRWRRCNGRSSGRVAWDRSSAMR